MADDKAKSKKADEAKKAAAPGHDGHDGPSGKLDTHTYEAELHKLQVELVKLQEWIKHAGLRVAVIFEGRDAAGKGGTIKRITEYLNPRVVRIAALHTPTRAREDGVVLPALRRASCPPPARWSCSTAPGTTAPASSASWASAPRTRSGSSSAPAPSSSACSSAAASSSLKYWFSVSDDEQERRFQARVKNPLKQWKLSPMDLESRLRWVEYSKAKDEMFSYTDTKDSPWWVVNADDKKRARLNMIHHLLSLIPYEDVLPKDLELPSGRPTRATCGRPSTVADVHPRDLLTAPGGRCAPAPAGGPARGMYCQGPSLYLAACMERTSSARPAQEGREPGGGLLAVPQRKSREHGVPSVADRFECEDPGLGEGGSAHAGVARRSPSLDDLALLEPRQVMADGAGVESEVRGQRSGSGPGVSFKSEEDAVERGVDAPGGVLREDSGQQAGRLEGDGVELRTRGEGSERLDGGVELWR